VHIVKVNGGLGNQMFQYAFALVLDRLKGGAKLDLEWIRASPAHNGYELDRHFELRLPEPSQEERQRLGSVDPSLLGQVLRKLGLTKRSHFTARRATWEPRFRGVERDSYFVGYWQSYKYYDGMEDYIRAAFNFIEPLSERNKAFLGKAEGRTLIGVHVRRGDSLANPHLARVCGEEYYRAALGIVAPKARDPLFAFFSDDLDWCRERLAVDGEACYVDWNRGKESYADMRLMAACDSLIIANSSFSWWGAWLGERSGRSVICPSAWFSPRSAEIDDIAPLSWRRLGA